MSDAMTAGMLSSLTDDWETPPDVYAALHEEFGFTLDVAASPTNAKCARYFSIDKDGLAQDWAPAVCWMNPPYGRNIEYWVAKAAVEAGRGATVVGLVPARTDTRWWHSWVQPLAEIRFIRGRLRFSGVAKDAPFPSAIVVWRAMNSELPMSPQKESAMRRAALFVPPALLWSLLLSNLALTGFWLYFAADTGTPVLRGGWANMALVLVAFVLLTLRSAAHHLGRSDAR